jgi:hypothetical protein
LIAVFAFDFFAGVMRFFCFFTLSGFVLSHFP